MALSACQSSDFRCRSFDSAAQKYYHARLMSAAAVIDSLEFARGQQQLRGSLPVESLQRLEDVLFDPQGNLEYEVRGCLDERNRPQLVLKVRGDLHLQC